MARLADLLENYRNAVGRSTWNIGRDIDVMSGYDPDLAEFVEKSSLGTGGHGAGGLAGMIRASHGSPHAFTKFLMSKLGTGEGAQAYGHGLYFGEGFDSPVAQKYADDLSQWHIKSKEGTQGGGDFADVLYQNAGQVPESLTSAIRSQANKIATDLAGGKSAEQIIDTIRNGPYAKAYGGLADALEKLSPSKAEGNLYNVELRWPDAAREAADPLSEEHFLQWDEPFKKQPESVKSAWTKIAEEYGVPLNENELIGPTAHRAMLEEQLAKHGIPGIRYLDQGSRGAGTNIGTHNYVVFDENIPNIVSRNGVSLSDLLRSR